MVLLVVIVVAYGEIGILVDDADVVHSDFLLFGFYCRGPVPGGSGKATVPADGLPAAFPSGRTGRPDDRCRLFPRRASALPVLPCRIGPTALRGWKNMGAVTCAACTGYGGHVFPSM